MDVDSAGMSTTLITYQYNCDDIALIMPVDKLIENDAWEGKLMTMDQISHQNNRPMSVARRIPT